jgi:hypothetical protein
MKIECVDTDSALSTDNPCRLAAPAFGAKGTHNHSFVVRIGPVIAPMSMVADHKSLQEVDRMPVADRTFARTAGAVKRGLRGDHLRTSGYSRSTLTGNSPKP